MFDSTGEGSDTSYFSSTESVEVPAVNNKTKGLQTRHSLLDLVNSKNSSGELIAKKGQEAIKQEKTEDKEVNEAIVVHYLTLWTVSRK